MDEFEKPLAWFEKIARHLRHDRVLIGFVFFLCFISAASGFEPMLVFGLGTLIIAGLLGLSFLELRQQQLSASSRKNDDIEVEVALQLMEIADDVESVPLKIRLMKRAKRKFKRAGQVQFSSDAQAIIDEATEPPPDP